MDGWFVTGREGVVGEADWGWEKGVEE